MKKNQIKFKKKQTWSTLNYLCALNQSQQGNAKFKQRVLQYYNYSALLYNGQCQNNVVHKPICFQVSTCVTQRFSGISEEDVKGNHTSLTKVQETLLSFINADTILIGHSLETDLCALKVTTISFPWHNSYRTDLRWSGHFWHGHQFTFKWQKWSISLAPLLLRS